MPPVLLSLIRFSQSDAEISTEFAPDCGNFAQIGAKDTLEFNVKARLTQK
jgi:hypothetical protein